MSLVSSLILGIGIAIAVTFVTFVSLRGREQGRTARIRRKLAETPPPDGTFEPASVSELPEPARRYFLRAIAPGTSLRTVAELTMSGEFRLKPKGPWQPMSATQVLAPPHGFIWTARIGKGLWFEAEDRYAEGHGRLKAWLWGLLPVVSASGSHITRGQIGRMAGESVLAPASLLPVRGVTWTGVDAERARGQVRISGEDVELTLRVAADGRPREVVFKRWGDRTDSGNYQYIPFGARLGGELTVDGYRVPQEMAAGWWYGTERYAEFFRAKIESLELR